jgi:hypothetical protein
VTDNYGLNKVLGLNETGFKGTGDDYYRRQAWEFLLAGGGLYNNLDYSFCVGHEDGTFSVKDPTPGGGSPKLRRQLRFLAEFLREFDFIRLKPANDLVSGVPMGVALQVLAEKGKQYAIYLGSAKGIALQLQLPKGAYEGEWLDAVSGQYVKLPRLEHAGDIMKIKPPDFAQDCALRLVIKRTESEWLGR